MQSPPAVPTPVATRASLTARSRWRWRDLLVVFVSVAIAGFGLLEFVEALQPQAGVASETDVVKSPLDDRNYLSFALPNGLQVMVVSDPTTAKSAAAVDCAVGSNHDPISREGLAHLLEHLLFMGSRIHPKEDGYMKFLSAHGGSANAMTSSEHTNFYFEVDPQQLETAMGMLANALHDPLLSHSAIGREVLAVDAENSKKMHSDQWRLMQLLRRSAHPSHPFSRSGVGNYASLLEHNTVVRLEGELRRFHTEYYTASNMRLAVVGPQSLEQLRASVFAIFSKLRAVEAPPKPGVHLSMPFRELGRRIDFVPVRDLHLLQIVWPVEPLRAMYATKPAAYISHILGHEARHTLASYLIDAGLADGLTAGTSVELTSFSTVKLVVHLTAAGFANVERVLGVIFEYIERIRALGVQQWVHEEVMELSRIRFHYGAKAAAADLASTLASNLHYFPARDVLRAPSLVWHWSAEYVRTLLESLTLANALVFVGSSSYTNRSAGFSVDKEIGASYRIGLISADRAALGDALLNSFKLPEPNPYLPIELHSTNPAHSAANPSVAYSATPTLVQHNGRTKLWHVGARQAVSPKAVVYIHLMTPLVISVGAREAAMCALVRLVWEDSVRHVLHPAKLAGFHFSVGTSPSGFVLQASGFASGLADVVEQALRTMHNLKLDSARLESARQALKSVYRSVNRSQPLWYAQYLLKQLLHKHTWPHEILEYELDRVTLAEMEWFLNELVSRFHAEAFVYGALGSTDAVQLVRSVERIVGFNSLAKSSVPIQRNARLTSSAVLDVPNPNPVDRNSAVTKYIELGDDTPRARVMLQIVSNLAQHSFFTQLRSQEQLGYSVSCTGTAQYGKLGLLAQVQSHAHNTSYISARIGAWLHSFTALLHALPPDEFDAQLASVRQQLGGTQESDSATAERLWREIREHEFKFDRHAEQLHASLNLTVADLQLLRIGQTAGLPERGNASLGVRLTGAQLLRLLNNFEVRVQAKPSSAAASKPVFSRVLELRRTKASWSARGRSKPIASGTIRAAMLTNETNASRAIPPPNASGWLRNASSWLAEDISDRDVVLVPYPSRYDSVASIILGHRSAVL